MIVLSIDPGITTGGACVLDTKARRVLIAYEWRDYDARTGKAHQETEQTIERTVWLDTVDGYEPVTSRVPRSVHESASCGAALTSRPEWLELLPRVERVAVEGVGRYHASGTSQASAEHAAGMWVEWARTQTGISPSRPLPVQWRAGVLGVGGNTKSKGLDRAVERWSALVMRAPMLTPGGWDSAAIGWFEGARR